MKTCEKKLHSYDKKYKSCPECNRISKQKWHQANPDYAKNVYLKNAYGITLEQYNKMFKDQNNLCAICKQPESTRDKNGKIIRLALDHDHAKARNKNTSASIRELLCYTCNQGIGYLKDDPILLRNAADYIEKHRGVKDGDI